MEGFRVLMGISYENTMMIIATIAAVIYIVMFVLKRFINKK